jgi:hypothetical protein
MDSNAGRSRSRSPRFPQKGNRCQGRCESWNHVQRGPPLTVAERRPRCCFAKAHFIGRQRDVCSVYQGHLCYDCFWEEMDIMGHTEFTRQSLLDRLKPKNSWAIAWQAAAREQFCGQIRAVLESSMHDSNRCPVWKVQSSIALILSSGMAVYIYIYVSESIL